MVYIKIILAECLLSNLCLVNTEWSNVYVYINQQLSQL